jgi:hypothetical protein
MNLLLTITEDGFNGFDSSDERVEVFDHLIELGSNQYLSI